MRHRVVATLAALILVSAAWALDDPKDKAGPSPPAKAETVAEKLKALQQEMQTTRTDLQAKLRDAEKDEEKQEIRKELIGLNRKFVGRYLELAEQNSKDPAAGEALVMVFRMGGPTSAEAEKAADLIIKNGLYQPAVVSILPALARTNAPYLERLLRDASEHAKAKDDRGQATFALAEYVKGKAERPGADSKFEAEAEKLFQTVMEKYADVKGPYGRMKLGGMAKGALNEWKNLIIGKKVPDIEGEDIDGVKFKLSDYRGKVVMLDFWGNW